jgi:hypothetical protein
MPNAERGAVWHSAFGIRHYREPGTKGEEFENAREDYYTEGEVIRGAWYRELAARWRLTGEVREEHFQRLADGQHPITTGQLVRHQTARETTNARGERVTDHGACRN